MAEVSARSAPPETRGQLIFIVDEHRLLAEVLEQALTGRGFHCHVAKIDSSESIVEQAARIRPDLVLLDLDLRPIDGLDLIQTLRAAGRRVLVVTGCEDTNRLAAAVAMGSVGWVTKRRGFEEILSATECACRDRPLLTAERREHLVAIGRQYFEHDGALHSRIAALTPRERDVLSRIVHGDSAQEMADHYLVAVGTIRTHIRSVLTKLGVSSQLAAAAVAVEWATSKRGLDRDDLLAPLLWNA